MTRVWRPQLVVSVMLLWALYPENPYGYYVLLRIVSFGIFAYLAFLAYEARSTNLAWLLGFVAVVYNPVIRVHFPREIWSAVNVVTIGVAACSSLLLPRRPAGRELVSEEEARL